MFAAERFSACTADTRRLGGCFDDSENRQDTCARVRRGEFRAWIRRACRAKEGATRKAIPAAVFRHPRAVDRGEAARQPEAHKRLEIEVEATAGCAGASKTDHQTAVERQLDSCRARPA